MMNETIAHSKDDKNLTMLYLHEYLVQATITSCLIFVWVCSLLLIFFPSLLLHLVHLAVMLEIWLAVHANGRSKVSSDRCGGRGKNAIVSAEENAVFVLMSKRKR
jgi:hypothetical protein